MKIKAIEVRPGTILDHDGKLYVATKIQIVQPGRYAAIIHVEMKDVKTGVKTNQRFGTQELVERAQLEDHEMQYLYSEGEMGHFMNQENYEQIAIPLEVIGEPARFLQDNMIVTVKTHEGTPLSVELPQTVAMTITEADPVVKGQTASSSYKPATLENGVKIQVPPHIAAGMKVVVKTEDASYVERAKE